MGLNLKNIFSGGASELVGKVGGVLDNLITNKEELAKAKLELDKEVNRHMEVIESNTIRELELVIDDKKSARDMYKANSSLQKIYALVFLVAYIALTTGMIIMIYQLAGNKIELPEWGTVFISSIWGAMSTKVSTVTDFLFGAGIDTRKPK